MKIILQGFQGIILQGLHTDGKGESTDSGVK